LLVPCGYLLLAAAMFRFWNLAPFTNTLGGGHGDPAVFLWMLRWAPFAVEHGHNPFVTGYLNAPQGVNLLWNTSILLPGLLLAPITLLVGPVAALNSLLALGPALSAFAAYVAIRRWVPGHAAALGGLVYGFSPYMRGHSGHVNLTLAILPPLLLLLVDDILVRQQRRAWVAGSLLGAVAATQLLTGEELLATTALTALVVLVVLVLCWPTRAWAHAPHALRGLGVAALTCLALTALPLFLQFAGPWRYTGPASGATGRLVSDLTGFVVPGPLQALGTPAATQLLQRQPSNYAEQTAYLGLPLILVAVATAVRWWARPVIRVAALAALSTAVLSMGSRMWVAGQRTSIPLPWAAVDQLPLLDSVIPGRLSLYTTLFIGFLLAWFVQHAGRSFAGQRGRWTQALVATVVILAIVPLVPRPIRTRPVQVPAFFTGPAVSRVPAGSVALAVPIPKRGRTTPMLWHALAGLRFKMVGGYFLGPDRSGRASFGAWPSTTWTTLDQVGRGGPMPVLDARRCGQIRSEFSRWQVRTVILGHRHPHDRLAPFLTDLLNRPPESVDGVLVWWIVDPAAVCQTRISASANRRARS
jgi:hypothetical protein